MKKSSSENTKSHELRGWLFLFVVVVLVVGGVVLWREQVGAPGDENPIETAVPPEAPPNSVDVENLADGTRLVKNEEAGYEVKVSKDMYLYTDKSGAEDLVIQDYKEPADGYGGLPGCRVIVDVSEGNLENVESEAKEMCDQRSDCESYSVKEVGGYDIDWYEVKYFGEYVGAGWPKYKTQKAGKVYTLYFQCSDDGYIKNVLNNFSL